MAVFSNPPQSSSKIRFGLFEADLATGELRKSGTRIRIQAQPFRILCMLLERPGEIVAREEIQHQLWGSDTTVDFDRSLGTAVNKIREALGDSADNPRFIETIARRGYRFIAPVKMVDSLPSLSLPEEEPSPPPPNIPHADRGSTHLRLRLPLSLAGAALLVTAVLLVANSKNPPATASPPRITQVTSSGRVSQGDEQFESLGGTVTDGSRIYFTQIEKGRAILAEALIANGETSILSIPAEIAAPSLGDISPDGSKLLLRNHLATEAEQTLWIVSTTGGDARQISGVLAHDATWMPAGDSILYASGDELYVARENGSERHLFATLPGRAFWLRWSPDASRLRFTLLTPQAHTMELWEIDSQGRNGHSLFTKANRPESWGDAPSECCGSWTSDGRDFVFQSSRGGKSNIWQLPESQRLVGQRGPIQITNGPLNYKAPITSRSGNQVFFTGMNSRSDLLGYDARTRRFVPYARGLSDARRVEFSRDGQWVAWIKEDDDSLWRSRSDGSERIQLTARPLQVFMMRWSPDGKQLVLMGKEPGKPWKLYTADTEGNRVSVVLGENRNEADPDWSPDGTTIVFGRLPELMAEEAQPKAIYLLNLTTKKMEKIPGSQGLFSPRWSPDGNFIAALSIDQTRLMLFDVATQNWRRLALQNVADPVWSRDGKSILFHDFVQEGEPIYKISIADDHAQRVAELYDFRSPDVVDYHFAGLAPGDVPLENARLAISNIYTTTVGEPH